MFELTIIFKHEMIGFLPKFVRNFELTLLKLSILNLYYVVKLFM